MIHKPAYYRKRFLLYGLGTLLLVLLLNFRWFEVPAFARLLNPFDGFWQNAEHKQFFYSGEKQLTQLESDVKVLYDANRTPHLFAANDHDLYFMQGYLTARDRLWQMEMQTHAAAGRVSEVLGKKALSFDRKQRRKGMVMAAEKCLEEVNKVPETKLMIESYSEGVNAYISSLSAKDYPIEYKLLNYSPEPWTPLKCVLMLKLMADDLSGYSNDVSNTNAVKTFGRDIFDEMYPDFSASTSPIIPRGTPFNFRTLPIDSFGIKKIIDSTRVRRGYYNSELNVAPPATDSVLQLDKNSEKTEMPNGSNNWAVAGSKTKSGYPILCGDPHLRLTLPSIWYEMQMTIDGKSVQGATLPGAPGVIIGFNDSCAWSMTNAERDVRDLFRIKFKDPSQNEYWLDGQWKATEKRIEKIIVRQGFAYYDTVCYTVFGPVITDRSFNDDNLPDNLALSWMAHLPSNEIRTIYLLNRAQNYKQYVQALEYYTSPAQNFVFACKNKDIAIWEQGKFVAKWYEQGKFITPGDREGLVWKYFIPQNENPHVINPFRGYVYSANQTPTDSTYPYYYNGDYPQYRSWIINDYLEKARKITVQDMKKLQLNSYARWIEDFKDATAPFFDIAKLNTNEKSFYQQLQAWNLENTRDNTFSLFYKLWYDELCARTFNDEINQARLKIDLPNRDVFIHIIRADSSFSLWDDVTTSNIETEREMIAHSFDSAFVKYQTIPNKAWADYRNTEITHLAKLAPFSRKVKPDGEANSPNAITSDHGPSWRMVVSLTPKTEAYAIYPGGQSGNPGSSFYDNMIDKWEAGQYDSLLLLTTADNAAARSVELFHR